LGLSLEIAPSVADSQPGENYSARHPGAQPQPLAQLHSAYGNRAVLSALPQIAPLIQAKLTVNAPGDRYEQEADRVADEVMRMSVRGTSIQAASTPPDEKAGLQRKCACGGSEPKCEPCKEEQQEGMLQTKSAGVPREAEAPPIVYDVLRSPGVLLDRSVREQMESQFGQDLSSVRIHTDARAAASSQAVSADAYTVGRNVVFNSGMYAPHTATGRKLIAHELAHVIQQHGVGAHAQAKLTIGDSGDSAEHEADRAADIVVSGGAPARVQADESRAVVQRQDDDIPSGSGRGGSPRTPSLPVPDVVEDPTALSEPNCPPTPTGLGNIAPAPMCNEEGEEIDGEIFMFCRDSDVFRNRADLSRLRNFVNSQPSGTTFRVHTSSSVEGPGTSENVDRYNRNLSCHRLNRVIREFLNLGVQEQQIEAVSEGPTERFGTGAAARPRNRMAVIEADPLQQTPRPDATGMSMEQIRNVAKQRIENGDYPLQADAYFARWSCGRWRTLAEAVARTNVVTEEAGKTISAGPELGTTASEGANTIVLSPRIADTTDRIGCAANRITDLTFHHFSRPVLMNFEDQHHAGMHLVHLALFPECRIPANVFLGTPEEVRSRPIPTDPFTGFIPRCADQPLAGPLIPQRGPATIDTPPTFAMNTPLGLFGSSGSVVPSPSNNPITVGAEPDGAFSVVANVDAIGTPASIADFEIGFVQTVMAESWVNTYVDGRKERRRFPLPLRDGPPRNDPASEPPWFASFAKMPAAPGTNQVTLTDAPNIRAFRFLPDIPTSTFVESIQVPRPGGGRNVTLERPTFRRGVGPLLPANASQDDIERERVRREAFRNNAPDRGRRVIDFNTWVVARRRNAPATHGATQFLAGVRLLFNLGTDWSPTSSGGVLGTGSYNVTQRAASASDAEAVMLRGATPLDFTGPTGVPLFAEFLEVEGATPRAQAGGLDRATYFAEAERIARPHRTAPALRAAIMLRIAVEVATGRVLLDTPDLKLNAIRVLDADRNILDTAEARDFARAIYPEVRELIAGPSFSTNEPATGILQVPVRLPAL
jgi:hypothetical protein